MSKVVRVIPCLDIKSGRVVKGVQFTNLSDAGDPIELAQRYQAEGADEITFLDITASNEDRATTLTVLEVSAQELSIPITVGGGVRSVADVQRLLASGAKKVGIATAAVARPELLSEIADQCGRGLTVLSVDARRCEPGHTKSGYEVTTHGGSQGTGRDALEWITQAVDLGAGEVLLNSVDFDGTNRGFDLEMLAAAREVTNAPLIASGGAGSAQDFVAAAQAGADGVLAASVFHFGVLKIAEVKSALSAAGFKVA